MAGDEDDDPVIGTVLVAAGNESALLEAVGSRVTVLPSKVTWDLHGDTCCHCKLPKAKHDWKGGIGGLKSLTFLNLKDTSIKELPEGVGNCTALRELYLNRCEKLERLPNSIRGLKSLTYLDLECTSIKELPEAIGE